MKLLAVTCISLLWISFSAHSQSVDIPSTFNPVGSGARALGLGGSFIAMADDATAASWNPAALMQLRKPEVALVLSGTQLSEDANFSVTGDSSSNTTESNGVNYFAVSAPCSAETCGKNMVFSVNYQRLYDLSRDWDLNISRSSPDTIAQQQYRQNGALYAAGLSYAVQLSSNFNLGLTLNYWDEVLGQNGFTRTNNAILVGLPPSSSFSEIDVQVESDFSGVNFNLGALWTPYQKNEKKLTVGFVYKSEFEGDFNTSTQFYAETGNSSAPDSVFVQQYEFNTDSTLTMPSSFGVGFAYQNNDALTTSIDFYWTDWKSFKLTGEDGVEVSAITNRPIDETDIKSTVQVRIGGEYRIISQSIGANYIIPIRAGFFYDPVIGDNSNEDGYGIALGSGIAYEHWVFDIAYQYRWAKELGQSSQQQLGLSFDLQEHQVYASSFYRF